MNALVAEGLTLLKLGMPFSDPMADGPSPFNWLCERSLAAGTSVKKSIAYYY